MTTPPCVHDDLPIKLQEEARKGKWIEIYIKRAYRCRLCSRTRQVRKNPIHSFSRFRSEFSMTGSFYRDKEVQRVLVRMLNNTGRGIRLAVLERHLGDRGLTASWVSRWMEDGVVAGRYMIARGEDRLVHLQLRNPDEIRRFYDLPEKSEIDREMRSFWERIPSFVTQDGGTAYLLEILENQRKTFLETGSSTLVDRETGAPLARATVVGWPRYSTILRLLYEISRMREDGAAFYLNELSLRVKQVTKQIDAELLAIEKITGLTLEQLGVKVHGDECRFYGGIEFFYAGNSFSGRCFYPYIALPRKTVITCTIDRVTADQIILIENLTAFEAYIDALPEERSKEQLVFFTKGFAGSTQKLFLEKILKHKVPKQIWHWGDIDVGGFRIFDDLNRFFSQWNISLRPLWMDEQVFEKMAGQPLSDRDRSELTGILKHPLFGTLAGRMIDKNKKVEQEEMILFVRQWLSAN